MEMDLPPTPPPAEPLTIFHREEDWCCAGWQRLFIQVWHGAANAERAQIVCDAMAHFERRHASGVASVIVLGKDATVPDAGARAVFASEARRIEGGLLGLAYLADFPGFKGSAMRGVLTALRVVARETFASRVFGDRQEASTWLAELLAPAAVGETGAAQPSRVEIEAAEIRLAIASASEKLRLPLP